MVANELAPDRDDAPVEDQIVVLRGVTWADYQRLLEVRGDCSAPRLTYREGDLELMSPSNRHEIIKSFIGRLVEVFCFEAGVELTPVGSWTIEDKARARGIEPDECYVFGPAGTAGKTRPDLAIEVVWTSGGVNKLDVYRALGVAEVWYWRRGKLSAFVLHDDGYVESSSSRALPAINLAQLASFLDRQTLTAAVRDYRDAIRSP